MNGPSIDTRKAQAERVADYLERHPKGSTLADLNAACDLGSPTKVISDMRRKWGYGIDIRKGPAVHCVNGTKLRRVRLYVLLHRPAPPAQLTLNIE